MLNPDQVRGLLDTAQGDVPEVRVAAASAITHLPLTKSTWQALGPSMRSLLDTTPQGSAVRRRAIEVAAGVPLRSVRQRLERIAADEADEDARWARHVLGRDSGQDAIALVDAAFAGDIDALEGLACMPLEDIGIDPNPLRQFVDHEAPDVRLWAALALARLGETAPLDAVLENLPDDLPSLFWGAPWTAYDRLSAMQPVPAHLRDYLLAKHETSGKDLAHEMELLIWAVTGVADAEGSPINLKAGEVRQVSGSDKLTAAEPDRQQVSDRDVEEFIGRIESDLPSTLETLLSDPKNAALLRVLSAQQAARVMAAALHRVAEQAVTVSQQDPMQRIALGNALVDLASQLPADSDLPVEDTVTLNIGRLRRAVDDTQIAYVLSRAGSERVCSALEKPLRRAVDSEEKLPILQIIEAVGDFEKGVRPVPVMGAGPGGEPTSAMAGPESIIEDYEEAGGHPPETRTAWPHLACPDAVVVGVAFALEVGLRAERDPLLEGTGEMRVLVEPFTLEVEIMLDGFAIVGDRAFTLDVTAEDLYPIKTVQLVAVAGADLADRRRIGVTFRIRGEMRGYAAREVVVAPTAEEADAVERGPAAPSAPTSDVSPFDPDRAADLSIVIKRGDDVAGNGLQWGAGSPLVALERPKETPKSNLGTRPDNFLSQIVKKASSTPDALNLFSWLEGVGRDLIASKIPREIRDAIGKVTEAVKPAPPTILLVTEDPYVPWELAVLDPPPTPQQSSPFLGARAVVGRWTLSETQPPPPRPPLTVEVRERAVISGTYDAVPGWKRLESAEEEAIKLLQRWTGAYRVNASFEEVLDCIRGTPPADILHFALHGQFQPDSLQDGLVLIGHPPGKPDQNIPEFLQPGHISSGHLPRAPLVFLNACQVGAGSRVLGDYSGMAQAFLFAGAAAVVAAMWSIDDKVASMIALDFYARSLETEPAPPAELLTSERAKVTEAAIRAGSADASTTRLAYQFFGHPKLQLVRP